MATYTATVAPDSQSFGTFSAWASAISAAFATFAWVQAADTGQAVFVASVMTANITAVALVSGTTYRYTYTSVSSGPALRVGMSLAITGFTGGNTGNNGAALVITSLAGGAGTFDVVNATGVACSGTAATGTTTVSSLPGIGATVYEIWQTSDSVGFPVSVKMEYGPGSGITRATVLATIGTGSNGSGTIVNPSVRTGTSPSSGSTTAYACHFSGDGGRMVMNLFHGQAQTAFDTVMSLERSYDNSGTPTGSYYTLCSVQGNLTFTQQTLFPTGALTTQENGGLIIPVPRTATSGNVGSTTHVGPVFPLVGGLGNPQTNIMGFRATDFADNQVVYVTIYGVQHPYITDGFNAAGITFVNVVAGLMMRYD